MRRGMGGRVATLTFQKPSNAQQLQWQNVWSFEGKSTVKERKQQRKRWTIKLTKIVVFGEENENMETIMREFDYWKIHFSWTSATVGSGFR